MQFIRTYRSLKRIARSSKKNHTQRAFKRMLGKGHRCNRHKLQHIGQPENLQKASESIKVQFQTAI